MGLKKERADEKERMKRAEKADEKERMKREKRAEIMGGERNAGLIKIYIYIYIYIFTIVLQYNSKDRIVL